jgi:hypothetical protein
LRSMTVHNVVVAWQESVRHNTIIHYTFEPVRADIPLIECRVGPKVEMEQWRREAALLLLLLLRHAPALSALVLPSRLMESGRT